MARKMSSRARFAFVTPRYRPGVVGGSEAVMAEAARGLAGRGYQVEILTTCARSHFSWANEFDEGTSEDRGVLVRPFSDGHVAPTPDVVQPRAADSRWRTAECVDRDHVGEQPFPGAQAVPASAGRGPALRHHRAVAVPLLIDHLRRTGGAGTIGRDAVSAR